jgi:hypothetical protein
MRPLHPGLLALTLLLGCGVGTTTSGYQPARGPAGASIDLELSDGRKVHGELLAVETDRLLVLQTGRLVRVPMTSLEHTSAPKVSHAGPDFPADVRTRLRLISRYPQGVTGELESRLLQAYNQSAVDEVS